MRLEILQVCERPFDGSCFETLLAFDGQDESCAEMERPQLNAEESLIAYLTKMR